MTASSGGGQTSLSSISDVRTSNRLVQLTHAKSGFTLAEVLITLAIIGVVAALTLPIVVSKYKKMVTVTQLKHAYSELAQGLKMAEAHHGDFKDWDYVTKLNWTQRDPYDFIDIYLKPYVKNLKIWETETGPHGTHITVCGQEYNVKVRGTETPIYGGGNNKWASFAIPNGSCVAIDRNQDNNEATYASSIAFWVDVNGKKGPNLYGVDLFKFYIDRDTGILRPWLYNRPVTDATAGSSGCGWQGSKEYCTYKIMQDGWQIKDDYPW